MKSFSIVKSFLKKGRVQKTYLLLFILLSIFPVVILTSYYYPSVRKVTSDNLYSANEQTVSQIQSNMDNQLNYIFRLPYMINNHQNLLRFDLENDELARYKAKYEIYNLARSNTILTVMYLYNQKIKHFIAPTGYGSFKLSQIQSSPFVYGTGFTMGEEKDLDQYLSSLEENTVLRLQNAQIESTVYPEMLCFILPLSCSNNSYGDVIAFVDCQKLKNLSGNLESTKQQVFFFNASNQFMCGTHPRPDEDIGRLGLESENGSRLITLSDGKYILSETRSKTTGWRYISLLPYDRLISRVNHLTVSTLILLAGMILVSALLILLTMKKTYQPIRELSGLSSNILKKLPNSKSMPDNDEMETVFKALSGLQAYNEHLDSSMEDIRLKMHDYLIQSLLERNNPNAKEINSDLTRFSIYLLPPFRAACIRYASESECSISLGLLNEMIDEDIQLFAIHGQFKDELCVLVSGSAEKNHLIQRIRDVADFAQLALGEMTDEISQIHQSYAHASEIMDQLRLQNRPNQVVEYNSAAALSTEPAAMFPLEPIQLLLSALSNQDTDQVEFLTERIIQLLRNENISPFYVRNVYQNVISIINSAANHQFPFAGQEIQQTVLCDDPSRISLDRMIYNMRQAVQIYTQYCNQENHPKGYSRIIEAAVKYIEEHLSDTLLSLQSVAEHLKISPSNLSRTFKDETGGGFKEYVDHARLQEAKKLLIDTKDSVDSIAKSVGYDNSSSFSRRFRSMCGLSPSEFRNSAGNGMDSMH